MEVAIPVFDRFTALDAVGPYQVLAGLPGARVRFLGPEAGPVASDNRMLTLVAEAAYEDVPHPDVLVFPGGNGTRALLADERVLGWVRSVHRTSTWTTSVCTGSLVLAAAGVLAGTDATTHWMARDVLDGLGACAVPDRVVERGKVITAAGVSSGIDMALVLAARIAGEETAKAIQLAIEYDPEPPYDAGAPEKAGAHIRDRVAEVLTQMEGAPS
jgi:putative intracellular protease/amidase